MLVFIFSHVPFLLDIIQTSFINDIPLKFGYTPLYAAI